MIGTRHIGLVLAGLLVTFGCSKKEEGAPTGKAGAPAAASSSLPWTPVNYGEMSATCKKALACCEEVAKADGAKSAEDYNLKCSGPALWKDADCEVDLKSRLTGFEAAGTPVPAACK